MNQHYQQLEDQFKSALQSDLKRAYYAGVRDGLIQYAHWKDGVQYVGTCGKTLAEALREVNELERQKAALSQQ